VTHRGPFQPQTFCDSMILRVLGDGSPPASYLLGPQELQDQQHCLSVAAGMLNMEDFHDLQGHLRAQHLPGAPSLLPPSSPTIVPCWPTRRVGHTWSWSGDHADWPPFSWLGTGDTLLEGQATKYKQPA